MRRILLPWRESPIADRMLDQSLDLARRFGARLDVLHVRPPAEDLLPYATLGLSEALRRTVTQAAEQGASTESAALRARFEARRDAAGLSATASPDAGASAAWCEESGRRDAVIARHGRLYDLIIVARPSRVQPPPRSFDAALRETGRPVLMLPRESDETLDLGRVAIAWNGSREAASAISAALPCLGHADAVTVLCSTKRMAMHPNGDDVVEYLNLHGIGASTRVFDAAGRRVGPVLLEEAAASDATLLVTGAYSRGKVREMIVGGVTGHVMSRARIPVLMVH